MGHLQTSGVVVLPEKRRKLSQEREESHKVTFIPMQAEEPVDHKGTLCLICFFQ